MSDRNISQEVSPRGDISFSERVQLETSRTENRRNSKILDRSGNDRSHNRSMMTNSFDVSALTLPTSFDKGYGESDSD